MRAMSFFYSLTTCTFSFTAPFMHNTCTVSMSPGNKRKSRTQSSPENIVSTSSKDLPLTFRSVEFPQRIHFLALSLRPIFRKGRLNAVTSDIILSGTRRSTWKTSPFASPITTTSGLSELSAQLQHVRWYGWAVRSPVAGSTCR